MSTDSRIARYVAFLLERNRSLNLTAARDAAAVAEHIADSLALVPYIRAGPHIDIGSGGGFPGIPLAIATGVRMTLVESVLKKARFLREVVEDLGLDAQVLSERAEEVGQRPEHRECYASATARAVGPLPTVMELTVPFLSIGGVAILQRGTIDPTERTAATDAALVLGAHIIDEIPLGDHRSLILVEKRTATSLRFPRRAGIPAKRPLCLDGGERSE
ncbi:MAG TPA: 16S rRNA (guanine(527)-N(7))-methyltransferase RsmG [Candidatus Baltobacteraceae bacterium]|jgi:16S rRNA (guanine527-N7)-methyltransferase|nr:16S rRNA (guanine(527)-N(7))-methyltransferase RsmG [Candidatus Baltobacteraceae bacterium]